MGTVTTERRALTVRHDGKAVSVPWIEFRSTADGPTAFLSAGMHGDEINGIAVIRRFLEWLEDGEQRPHLRGRLVVLPVLNPSGFAMMQRRVAEDNQDLNRSFGSDPPACFSQALARTLCEEVFKNCNFGIDLHDAGGQGALVPHCRVHDADDDDCERCSTHLGRLLGTTIMIRRPGNPAMLANHLRQRGVPVLTVELGGGRRVYGDFVEDIVGGIANVLRHQGLLPGEVKLPERQFFLRERYGVSVPQPCAVRFSVPLGAEVHAGDPLGELYDPLRHRLEPIISPMCGYLFSLYPLDQAAAGQRLYSILEHDHCHVERTTLKLFRELTPLNIRKLRM